MVSLKPSKGRTKSLSPNKYDLFSSNKGINKKAEINI